jgi:gliding motility-associated-like protein
MSDNLTITPKSLTVTADAKTKIYGDADPALTYTYTPALIGSDAFSGVLSRTAGENIGTYAINQNTLSPGSNYTVTYVSNNLAITPKTITVTADATTKIYGDADPALTYTYAPALIGSDAFTGALSRVAGENVGAYAINQGTVALSSNYTITYVSNNLNITARPITVTADAKSKVYGDADPALTYTYTPALIGSDAFTGALSRTAGENVGAYAINQGTVALSSNYTITYVSNNLTITPKTITVTADAKSKTYGDADPAFTYTYTPALIGGDAFTGALGRNAGEHVGSYAITKNTLALSSNYTIVYVAANLVINKALLTVTAGNRTICFNESVGVIPVTYTGFKFTDGVLAINPRPTVKVPAYTMAGTYVLTPSGGVAADYDFNYVSGVLTVLPIPAGSIAQIPIGPGIVNTPNVASGVQLTAPSATGYTYNWSTGETTATITVKASGTYSVKVTNAEGCSTTFTVQVVQQTLIIPNIFSPNGDGIHDKWVIENLENFPGNVVQIYNRYGQLVFKMTNYTPWDGKVNGRDMPVGTYYYIIDAKNGQKPTTGYIDIIR